MTFIETILGVALLGLLASAVSPNLVALHESRLKRTFRAETRLCALLARETSIRTGVETLLILDDAQNTFRVVQETSEEGETEFKRLALRSGTTTLAASIGGVDTEGSEWRQTFYPDGTADGGALTLGEGKESFSLVIEPTSGAARIEEGTAQDPTQTRWEAGNLETRL